MTSRKEGEGVRQSVTLGHKAQGISVTKEGGGLYCSNLRDIIYECPLNECYPLPETFFNVDLPGSVK